MHMDVATANRHRKSKVVLLIQLQHWEPIVGLDANLLMLENERDAVGPRLENPCVGGSIPPRATKNSVNANANPCRLAFLFQAGISPST
jgi:hypothetical protein